MWFWFLEVEKVSRLPLCCSQRFQTIQDVTETLWPDFNRARLLDALVDFQKRERRYGGIQQDATNQEPAISDATHADDDSDDPVTEIPAHELASQQMAPREDQHNAFEHTPRLARK